MIMVSGSCGLRALDFSALVDFPRHLQEHDVSASTHNTVSLIFDSKNLADDLVVTEAASHDDEGRRAQ